MANNFFDIFKSPFSLLSPCLVLLLTAIQDQRAASCSQPLQEDFICHSTWKKDQNFPPYIFSPKGIFQLDSSKGKHEFHPHLLQSLKSFRRCFSHPSILGSLFYLSIKEHTQSSIFNFVDNAPLYLGGGNFLSIVAQKKLFKEKFILNSQPSSYNLTLQFSRRRKKTEASFKWIAPSRPREINITKRWLKIWS